MEGQAGNRLQGAKQKKNRPVVPGCLIPVGLIVIVAFSGVQIWQWFSSRLVEIQPLKKDVVVQEIPASAVLIKKEIPVQAPLSGEVKMLVEDGKRLQLGGLIANIKGIKGNVKVYSPRAGLLCTHVDGLEGTLRPENVNVLDMKSIEKIGISNKPLSAGEVEKGVPFCKLIDNLEPLLIYLKIDPNTNIEKLDKRERFDLSWQGERFSGRLLESRGRAGKEFLLQITVYPEELLHRRHADVRVVVDELKGYPVASDALVFHDHQPGILIIKQEFVRWVPVEIAGHLNGKVVLNENGLEENTRYVINPRRVEEGSRLEW